MIPSSKGSRCQLNEMRSALKFRASSACPGGRLPAHSEANFAKQVTVAAALPGWPSSADGVSYPPAPWHLQGTAYVSAWRVPAACLPPGVRPMMAFGRAVVGTAWAAYGPGGVLAYNEVLAAVRVRVGGRSFTTITDIWVDHPASIAGGRELWGIPKQQALFQVHDGRDWGGGFAASAATPEGQPIAALRFRGRAALPGRWRLHTRTAQWPADQGRGEDPRIAKAEALASVELGAAAWSFAPDGPLGYLSGRAPFLSARLAGLALRFGG